MYDTRSCAMLIVVVQTVEFRLKITLAPHWPVRSKIVEAAPGTNIRPSHSPSPFILSGRVRPPTLSEFTLADVTQYAERSIVPEYVERYASSRFHLLESPLILSYTSIHKIMRDRHILRPDTSPKK